MTISGRPVSGARRSSCSLRPLLLRDPVVLQLQEEPVLAEDVAVLAGEPAGQLPVVHLEGLGDLAAEAGRHADQALAVPGQVLPVDAGLVVVAVDVGVGDQPAQVLVAGHVGRQQHEVEGLAVGLALLVRHRPPGDVGLHADDRLDARLGGRLVERDRAVERAVVGDGEAVEAVLDRRVDEVGDPPQPVEQAELRVGVEVDEVVRGDGHGTSMVARQGASGRARRVSVRRRFPVVPTTRNDLWTPLPRAAIRRLSTSPPARRRSDGEPLRRWHRPHRGRPSSMSSHGRDRPPPAGGAGGWLPDDSGRARGRWPPSASAARPAASGSAGAWDRPGARSLAHSASACRQRRCGRSPGTYRQSRALAASPDSCRGGRPRRRVVPRRRYRPRRRSRRRLSRRAPTRSRFASTHVLSVAHESFRLHRTTRTLPATGMPGPGGTRWRPHPASGPPDGRHTRTSRPVGPSPEWWISAGARRVERPATPRLCEHERRA